MALVDGEGVPLGLLLDAANKSEFKLAEPTLNTIKDLPHQPEVVVGDKGYDDKAFRRLIQDRGMRDCIPHRWHKDLQRLEDILEYLKRWHVERTFAWFNNFRHLTTRYERYLSTFSGFICLAASLIGMRKLVFG